MNRVVISGMGLVCSSANNVKDFANSLFNGKIGIKKCSSFDTTNLSTPFFGETCDDFNFNDPYNPDSIHNNRLYSMLKSSVEEMFLDSNLNPCIISSKGNDCRLYFGSFLYPSEAHTLRWKAKRDGLEDHSFALINDYSAYARKLTGVKGMVTTSTAACASSTAAIGIAFDVIRNGLCNSAIVIGIDNLNIGEAYGFHALKLLSQGICNPYDKNRDGINIGESSVVLYLENLDSALNRNANIYCEINGYALGNDAYHIISPEPSGESAANVMKSAINDAKINVEDIDYINGHGTGTLSNDTMEIKAIEKLIDGSDKDVWLSSTKSMVGHCMGAAGAIELASVALSITHQKYIPMPNLTNPIDHSDHIKMSNHTRDLNINYALTNNFAFAGNNAVIVLGKFK